MKKIKKKISRNVGLFKKTVVVMLCASERKVLIEKLQGVEPSRIREEVALLVSKF